MGFVLVLVLVAVLMLACSLVRLNEVALLCSALA